ncbi:glutaminase A [Nesterenkonia sp. CF4.4]|uniref:glutaminase A n=1 Tax=Nesterenkonia sp. CF4.4 TaxID=3373079 RepID=UPI003EE7D600
MHESINTYLREVLKESSADVSGKLAAYIPRLRDADENLQALALATADGQECSAGDDEHLFTIQSISKPFVYALALDDIGLDRVREMVGMEPSGEAFNELSLEGGTGRPLNPMINAGAIATHHLVDHTSHEEHPGGRHSDSRTSEVRSRTTRILDGMSAFAGRALEIDWDAAEEEYSTAYRNMAIAHMLKSHGSLETEPDEAVRGYIDQCSILVTVKDIARMAATLANNGVNPETGQRVVSAESARTTLGIMATCGMYDASGRWLTQVGIPAKSGISGGIIGVLPGQVGIASFAPRLNEEGSSVQGVAMFQHLSNELSLHLMSNERINVIEELERRG